MRLMNVRTICFVVIVGMIGSMCCGDIVWLKSGERREGLVIEEGVNLVVFVSAAGELRINKNLVERIEKEPKDVSYVKIGSSFLATKKYEHAIREFSKALAINPDNEDAQNKTLFARGKLRELERHKRKEKSLAINDDFYKAKDLIGESKFSGALELLAGLKSEELSIVQEQKINTMMSDLYYKWGIYKINKLDNDTAIVYLEKSKSYNPKNHKAQEELVQLLEAVPERRGEALKAYLDILERSPEKTELKIKIADIYFTDHDYLNALPYYVEIYSTGNFRRTLLEDRLKSCFDRTIAHFARSGQFDQAIEFAEQRAELFELTDRSEIDRLQYAAMKSSVESDDIEGRIDILIFLRESGMEAEAIKETKRLLMDDPGNREAFGFYSAYAKVLFNKAYDEYSRGYYDIALSLSQDVIVNFPLASDEVKKASDLGKRAKFEIGRTIRQNQEKAKDLVRNAQSFYNQALVNIQNLKRDDISDSGIVASDKYDARKNLELAIERWEKALKLDPTLGPEDGSDLYAKIQMAQYKLRELRGRSVDKPIGRH